MKQDNTKATRRHRHRWLLKGAAVCFRGLGGEACRTAVAAAGGGAEGCKHDECRMLLSGVLQPHVSVVPLH